MLKTNIKSNFFKYSELKKFLIQASEYGEVTSFEKVMQSNGIILRHDVDFDVNAARRVAELEKECGVSSTFFFLTSCPMYNLNSPSNRKAIQKMDNEGFEIGLHFDPTLYPDNTIEELEQKAIFEASIIEFITGKKLKSISLHNPSIHGQYPIFDGFLNTYAPEYYQSENYMSDSKMGFRDKNPYEFIKKATTSRLQINLHPLHYSETGGNYPKLLLENVYHYTDSLHEYISVNSQYVEEIKGKTLREILLADTD